MVFYDPSPLGVEYTEVADRAEGLEKPLNVSGSRLVVSSNTPPFRGNYLIKELGNREQVHIQTATEAIEDFIALINILAEEKRNTGFVYQPPAEPVKPRDDPYVRQKRRPVPKKRVTVGGVLPDVVLKNEKGEDVHVAALAKETGVIIFAVPKANTRELMLLRACLWSYL